MPKEQKNKKRKVNWGKLADQQKANRAKLTFALDGRSKLFDGLYRVVRGNFTVAYFESEADAVAYVAAGNNGRLEAK
jgi:hypothetical protein